MKTKGREKGRKSELTFCLVSRASDDHGSRRPWTIGLERAGGYVIVIVIVIVMAVSIVVVVADVVGAVFPLVESPARLLPHTTLTTGYATRQAHRPRPMMRTNNPATAASSPVAWPQPVRYVTSHHILDDGRACRLCGGPSRSHDTILTVPFHDREYVERCFKAARPSQRSGLQQALRLIIQDAQTRGLLFSRPWGTLPPPNLNLSPDQAAAVVINFGSAPRSSRFDVGPPPMPGMAPMPGTAPPMAGLRPAPPHVPPAIPRPSMVSAFSTPGGVSTHNMINRKRCMDEGLTTSSKVKKRHHSIQHDTQVRQRWYMYFVVDRSIHHHHTESLSRYRLLSRFGRSFVLSFVLSGRELCRQ